MQRFSCEMESKINCTQLVVYGLNHAAAAVWVSFVLNKGNSELNSASQLRYAERRPPPLHSSASLNVFFPGARCSEPCSEGLWGRHCNQTCFKHCPNSDTCVKETGACVCRPGFWGVTCQNSECRSLAAALFGVLDSLCRTVSCLIISQTSI